jgi:hypothetical protein
MVRTGCSPVTKNWPLLGLETEMLALTPGVWLGASPGHPAPGGPTGPGGPGGPVGPHARAQSASRAKAWRTMNASSSTRGAVEHPGALSSPAPASPECSCLLHWSRWAKAGESAISAPDAWAVLQLKSNTAARCEERYILDPNCRRHRHRRMGHARAAPFASTTRCGGRVSVPRPAPRSAWGTSAVGGCRSAHDCGRRWSELSTSVNLLEAHTQQPAAPPVKFVGLLGPCVRGGAQFGGHI